MISCTINFFPYEQEAPDVANILEQQLVQSLEDLAWEWQIISVIVMAAVQAVIQTGALLKAKESTVNNYVGIAVISWDCPG